MILNKYKIYAGIIPILMVAVLGGGGIVYADTNVRPFHTHLVIGSFTDDCRKSTMEFSCRAHTIDDRYYQLYTTGNKVKALEIYDSSNRIIWEEVWDIRNELSWKIKQYYYNLDSIQAISSSTYFPKQDVSRTENEVFKDLLSGEIVQENKFVYVGNTLKCKKIFKKKENGLVLESAEGCDVPEGDKGSETADLDTGIVSSDKIAEPKTLDLKKDTDGDGLLDYEEKKYNADYRYKDTDNDGLTDYQEVIEKGTKPNDPDTDNDGVNDYEDYAPKDPRYQKKNDVPDSDGDGVNDYEEVELWGTDPKISNTKDEFMTAGEAKEAAIKAAKIEAAAIALAERRAYGAGKLTSVSDSTTLTSDIGTQGGLEQVGKGLEGSGVSTETSAILVALRWINFALGFVGVLAFMAFVYAGFLYVANFGNDDMTSKAKNIMFYAVAGLILIFSAFAIVNTIIGASA